MAKKAKKKPRKNITIELQTGVGAVPDQPLASKASGDRVRWWNRSDRGHTIEFTIWPFVEAPQAIAVEAGAKSGWFTVYNQSLNTLYDYSINPTINPSSGPPGDPGVLIGD